MFNIEDERLLIDNLINNEDDSRIQTIAKISDQHTFNAKGINIDYILYLEQVENKSYKVQKFPIFKLFDEIFLTVSKYASNRSTQDFEEIIRFIISSELITASRSLVAESRSDSFNYCIALSDKYIPIIYINLEQRLNNLLEKKIYLEKVYHDKRTTILNSERESEINKTKKLKEIEVKFTNSLKEIKSELCKYIVLWIHCYRFLEARKQLLNSRNVIAFSHRYKGWSKPRFKVNNNLSVEFKTNFGYGLSSYFYLLLIFKGVQVFPFTDWINYQFAQVSEMENYSKRYHQILELKATGKSGTYTKRKMVIEQEFWEDAFRDLERACNICEEDPKKFINTYVLSSLDSLVSELEEVIGSSDKRLNQKHRDFDEGFSIRHIPEEYVKEITLISVKGALISGTLNFVDQVIKLKDFIATEYYVKKIEGLNLRLLPLLEDSIPSFQEHISELESKSSSLKEELIDIWNNQGLKELKQKSKLNKLEALGINELEKLEEQHASASSKKIRIDQEVKHLMSLLKTIERYIRSIEDYFKNARAFNEIS